MDREKEVMEYLEKECIIPNRTAYGWLVERTVQAILRRYELYDVEDERRE